jgi:ectoine hydroxylase-related dioxygenase (phytanoyl-CoA dioxygenase family)
MGGEILDKPFPDVPGLEDFRACVLRLPGAPARMDRQMRVMLSALGLGLEQVLTFVGQSRPSLAQLQRWILETAGLPAPETLARYGAMVEGKPPPPATQACLDAIEAMAPVLDDAEIARWERDGYAILREAITPQEIAAAAALVWRLSQASPDDRSSWYQPRVQGIMVQHFQSAEQEAVRRSPRIHKAFAQLWGTANLWPSIDRMGFSAPVTQEAPFRASPLHWDCSLHWPIPYAMFGVLYLGDTAPDQGAFRLVPGFHHGLQGWMESLGDQDPRAVYLDDRAVPVAGSAGDLIICRHDLPHGASPNHAQHPRLVQYISMTPEWLSEQDIWR